MSPIFTNQSCDPFTPRSQACLIGNYAIYSINVTEPNDIVAGLQFAQQKNIRLTIKNTGHEYVGLIPVIGPKHLDFVSANSRSRLTSDSYLGKSIGKGSLSLWTHNLKSTEVLDYKNLNYNGKAIKIGAGIQAFEAYEFAESHGLRLMGGECSTVGLAGGYSQGGGHSMLSSKHGLAADNTLEWEVITAAGQHLVASPTQNSDLYWALSGGGGGTYAVVLSLTTKAFPDGSVAGASLSFNTSTMSVDTYWELIGIWQTQLPKLVDQGSMMVYSFTNTTFGLSPLTSLGQPKEYVASQLKPFIDELNKRKIKYSYSITVFPTFLQHFANYFGPLPDGIFPVAQVTGGRLVQRKVVKENNKALTSTFRKMVQDGTFYIGALVMNANHTVAGNQPGSNAVLPAWRDTLIDVLIVSTWNFKIPFKDMQAVENRLTNEIVPEITAVSPGSGTYLNEGDFQNQNWKQDFYGSNYAKLLGIKHRYDPNKIFYATTAVGSDEWAVQADGRLCRA